MLSPTKKLRLSSEQEATISAGSSGNDGIATPCSSRSSGPSTQYRLVAAGTTLENATGTDNNTGAIDWQQNWQYTTSVSPQPGQTQRSAESNDAGNRHQERFACNNTNGNVDIDAHTENINDEEEDDELGFDASITPVLLSPVTTAMASLDLNYDGTDAANMGSSGATTGNGCRQKGDEMQERAVLLAEQGKNLFLTGRAGTGKSWTTKQIVASLQNGNYAHAGNMSGEKKRRRGKMVHVTAPTGLAAININGTTIHRWGGFCLGLYYSDFDMMMSKKNRERIRKTEALVIDEISMMSGHLFDVLECMVTIIRNYDEIKDRLKAIKRSAPLAHHPSGEEDNGGTIVRRHASAGNGTNIQKDEEEAGGDGNTINLHMLNMRWKDDNCGGLGDLAPWGGMQLVLVGDFFQLPPIPNGNKSARASTVLDDDMIITDSHNVVGKQGTYAFQSRSWSRSHLNVVELVKVHRQAEDGGLLDLLSDIREGKNDLRARHAPAICAIRAPLPVRDDGIVPTILYPRNSEVDEKNRTELDNLPGKAYDFLSKDGIELDYTYKQRLLKKHKLNEVAHMPYLWACVETPTYPSRWQEAKREIDALKESKDRLLAEEKYEEIGPVRDKLKALEKEVSVIEREEAEKANITPSSINEWLEKNPTNVLDSAIAIFDRIEAFQKQLVRDFGNYTDYANKRFFQDECRVGNETSLKMNAQVILLWNLDIGMQLVNGSRGVVLGFVPVDQYKRLLEEELVKRNKLAEKKMATGKDDDASSGDKNEAHGNASNAKVAATEASDNKDTRPPTPATVTASSSLNADCVEKITGSVRSMADEELQRQLRQTEDAESHMKAFPFIQFATTSRLLLPVPFMKDFRGFFRAARHQIPLTHAWAISIHKSQGMTIDCLKADLEGCFSPGQAYVACSRGRSTATMQVDNFAERYIQTSDEVKRFYHSLANNDEYKTTTWADTLSKFEEWNNQKSRVKKLMERECGGRTCRMCHAPCRVQMVSTSKNGNQGRWYVKCTRRYRDGHTFDWVDEVDI